MKTEDSDDYRELFLRQVLQSLIYAHECVCQSSLTDDTTRDHALTALQLGFGHPAAWQPTRNLLMAVAPLMEQAGWREDWIPFLEAGIERACQSGDVEAVGECYYQLGLLHRLLGDFPAAEICFRESSAAFGSFNDTERDGRALNRWAYAAMTIGAQPELARSLVARAESLCTSDSERGYSCNIRGFLNRNTGNPQGVCDWYLKALEFWKRTTDPRLLAWGLTNLGFAQIDLEQYEAAVVSLLEALELFDEAEDPAFRAAAMTNLGAAYYHLNDPQRALAYLGEALPALRHLNRGHAVAVTYNAIGKSWVSLEQWQLAYDAYVASIELFTELGNIPERVNVMTNLADAFRLTGRNAEARGTLLEAAALLEECPDAPSYELYRDLIATDLAQLSETH